MSTTESFEEIAENMALFDDWEDRYRYLIDLGREMPALDEALKTQATKVDGCASQVWISPRVEGAEGCGRRLVFDGDSDAMIVRGLIAVLRALYSGRPPQEVLETDGRAAFARLGLDQHLSAQRSNGLAAMLERVKDLASAADA